MTFFEDFKLPIDPTFAISFIYNYPYEFTLGEFNEAINYTDSSGHSVLYKPDFNWVNDYDYRELITDFDSIRSNFIEKNIPVIIKSTGVVTDQKKEIVSIREYLYVAISLSMEYNGCHDYGIHQKI